MVSRAQRTPFGEWWWTVDRLTLAAIGALMLAGVVLSLAASPPVAGRLGLDPFYFVNRHILYLIPTVAIMLGGVVPQPAPDPPPRADRVRSSAWSWWRRRLISAPRSRARGAG